MTQITKTGTDFTREQIETIKQTVARGASDAQLALFLQVCKSRGLDPFTKQVYFTPQGVIVSIDGFRAIADRTGCYAPGDATRFERDDKGNLIAAHVHVKKLVAGVWHRVEASAFFDEYRGTSPIWKKMPSVMLEKCAEARALRKSFPSELSGIYESSEMDQIDRDDTPVRASVAVAASRPVVEVEAVVVKQSEKHSDFYDQALAAIGRAETMADLQIAAGIITKNKTSLLDGEADTLRQAYSVKRAMIGGAK
jgi:phage recombination protein Bet